MSLDKRRLSAIIAGRIRTGLRRPDFSTLLQRSVNVCTKIVSKRSGEPERLVGEGDGPRFSWLFLLVLLCIGAGVAAVVHLTGSVEAYARVIATEGRLTPAEDRGEDLNHVDRRARPEMWYRVTLTQVPQGTRLPLTCEWITPDGRVAHRNRYATRRIDKDPWPTYARHRFSPTSPTGTWTVRLLLQGRVLSTKTFEVGDALP